MFLRPDDEDSPVDVRLLSDDELRRLHQDCVDTMLHIRRQISSAKLRWEGRPTAEDRAWRARAQAALRLKGRNHQLLQNELGRRRKEANRQYQADFARAFVDVAKVRLSPELFQLLLDEARFSVAACVLETDSTEGDTKN